MYALSVFVNYHKSSRLRRRRPRSGLKELRLRSLTEILNGGVQISENQHLCYQDTIEWDDIVKDTNVSVSVERECLPCNKNCNGHCWGSGRNYCQHFTRLNCVAQCDSRCYGPKLSQCCNGQCAAGCSGPQNTHCFACKNFNDSGACINHCPLPEIYNRVTFQREEDPHVKYSYGALCVKECPHNFVVDYNSCVRVCPAGKHEVEKQGKKKCDPCADICPKACDGLGTGNLTKAQTVDITNIDNFENCTKINGNIAFLVTGINGDAYEKIPPLNPSKLNVFRSVKEITGYLMIQAWPENMTDLQVFANLTTIQGRTLHKGVSLLVSLVPGITSLGLSSLREISAGSVYLEKNENLCFYQTVNWMRLFNSPDQMHYILENKPASNCTAEGLYCHPLCSDDGCWGPGPSQCVACRYFRRGRTCVNSCYITDGPFREFENGSVCLPCDPECLFMNDSATCFGMGSHSCARCSHYKDGPHCVAACPVGVQGENNEIVSKFPDGNNTCQRCHSNCAHGCTGQGPLDCHLVSHRLRNPSPALAVMAATGLLTIILSLLLSIVLLRRRNIARKRAMRRFIEKELVEPLTPSGAAPNHAQLHILRETELRRGTVLGSGAFGTVHKGVWTPEGEDVKIPVAIKVLREGTSPKANKDFLDEAYIMASMSHAHLVRLLGVCLTPRVQLVTQLMPLGCLLEYVREHRDSIGSQLLLNWAVQIAKGMLYLEERRLVHRDLAARNVLVKTPQHVKITDFGLARLLDVNEMEYHADGGKLPIKWLALESIHYRTFTHQSDIWSYGVTIWELMTFGGKPYETIPAREIPEILEKGERLPQPPICTIDVYMIMVKCWMIDAESRPRFRELAVEFSKMARDPQRYLVIQGDERRSVPSPTNGLTNRSLSAEEELEGMVDAEEYLQPQKGFFTTSLPQFSSDSGKHEMTRTEIADQEVTLTLNGSLPASTHAQTLPSQAVALEGPCYMSQAKVAPQQKQMKSFNQRYSSDPTQLSSDRPLCPLDLRPEFYVSPNTRMLQAEYFAAMEENPFTSICCTPSTMDNFEYHNANNRKRNKDGENSSDTWYINNNAGVVENPQYTACSQATPQKGQSAKPSISSNIILSLPRQSTQGLLKPGKALDPLKKVNLKHLIGKSCDPLGLYSQSINLSAQDSTIKNTPKLDVPTCNAVRSLKQLLSPTEPGPRIGSAVPVLTSGNRWENQTSSVADSLVTSTMAEPNKNSTQHAMYAASGFRPAYNRMQPLATTTYPNQSGSLHPDGTLIRDTLRGRAETSGSYNAVIAASQGYQQTHTIDPMTMVTENTIRHGYPPRCSKARVTERMTSTAAASQDGQRKWRDAPCGEKSTANTISVDNPEYLQGHFASWAGQANGPITNSAASISKGQVSGAMTMLPGYGTKDTLV
uniref:receptor tyrosine-protein kinase erbB-4-like isoform X2 n=1 Tax=Myxine glutinosa TaxID=7769 RepID=UPI00358E9C57